MLIHKISATTSTNSHLKSLLKQNDTNEEMIVIAEEQLQGRGQMGTTWHSQRSKSLTFSMYKSFFDFEVAHQFYLSMVVSLAIKEVLEQFEIPEIKVKWPNDILSANKKICGILIENILYNNKIKGSIIGIGLNVNETVLDGLPNATSMILSSNKDFDLDLVFKKLVDTFSKKSTLLQNNQFEKIEEDYLKSLYGINRVSVFENLKKEKFNGIIQGVTREGKLLVKTEDETVISFGLKEIKLISGLK
jgi:BirA family biotin operon repressor/biotin-[acetyl-CoA-carboxylase] ligase